MNKRIGVHTIYLPVIQQDDSIMLMNNSIDNILTEYPQWDENRHYFMFKEIFNARAKVGSLVVLEMSIMEKETE